MLTFLSSTGLISQQLIRQAVSTLGEPQSLPAVRTMTEQIDSKTAAMLAIHLCDAAYRPASQYALTPPTRRYDGTSPRTVRPKATEVPIGSLLMVIAVMVIAAHRAGVAR
jgi:hypothetical protein